MKKDKTMLDNFLRISKQQGGTIHQFVDVTAKNFDSFTKIYNEFSTLFEFNSIGAFKKLADRCNFEGLKCIK